MLRHERFFPDVAKDLNNWFNKLLANAQCGVLVSHNTATDVQYLCCEYQRAGMKLPKKIKYVIDTLTTLRRFSSLQYRKVAPADWPELTKKGKLSMGVKSCAIYALSKRDKPETFVQACGEHHDADADTRAVAVILFDSDQFGNKGLYHCVFKSKRKCFQPLSEVWDGMVLKMQEPVLEFESLPPGWTLAEVGASITRASPDRNHNDDFFLTARGREQLSCF